MGLPHEDLLLTDGDDRAADDFILKLSRRRPGVERKLPPKSFPGMASTKFVYRRLGTLHPSAETVPKLTWSALLYAACAGSTNTDPSLLRAISMARSVARSFAVTPSPSE